MSEKVDDCVQSVLEDNPDYDESRAYAICNAMNNRGNLESVKAAARVELDEDPCWEGYTMVGTKVDESGNEVPNCVPDDDVPDAEMAHSDESECPDGKVSINDECVDVEEIGMPPSVMDRAAQRIHQLAELRTEPIERDENGDTVRYSNLALLETGVWTDQASETATLYPERALDDIEPEYDAAEYDGPPVNTRHDLDEQTGEVNEAAVAGYVDPDSLRAQDGALLGDIVLDLTDAAGKYTDDVLESSLSSGGSRGFGGPSVELDLDPSRHLRQSDHPEVEEEITGGYLTGLGLVDRPASKTVGFDHQTAERPVALADGDGAKSTYRLAEGGMNEVEAIRDALEKRGIDTDDMSDDELTALHEDMMDMDSDMGGYMADGDDDEDMADDMDGEDDDEEEEDDEDADMGGYNMADAEELVAEMVDTRIDELWNKIDELEEMMAGESEMAELREANDELARRLAQVETEPKEPKTLADGAAVDDDTEDTDPSTEYADAESGISSDTTGTFGR